MKISTRLGLFRNVDVALPSFEAYVRTSVLVQEAGV